jgi:hypothetical protein
MSRWGVKTSKAQDEQMFSGLPFEADLDLRVNEYTCPCRKLDSAIMVMKSAEDRPRCDAAYVLDGAMDRSVFAKRPMSPQLVIISGILRQDPA